MATGKSAPAAVEYDIERISAGWDAGLAEPEVRARMERGLFNASVDSPTRSVKQIWRDNIFTLFNIINFVLAVIIVIVGEYRNILFLGVAIANTALSIFQELRAKRTIDKLAIITEAKCVVVREGQRFTVPTHGLVLDDVMYISTGNQICADGDVLHSEGLEVDESLITGESNNINKKVGDSVLSGSFVVSGGAYVRVMRIGADNYAAKLSSEAKREKKPKSELMRSLDQIIRVLTFAIVPIGVILFISNFFIKGQEINTAVLGTTAAILGMIPEGLMLLTGVALAVGAINLARYKTMVQSMPCIETLARVDVLCLDKTGTITDGSLTVTDVLPMGGAQLGDVERAVADVLAALSDDNATNRALKARFGTGGTQRAISVVPFSSARKWSGAQFQSGVYVFGAPEFVLKQKYSLIAKQIEQYQADGLRTLVVARSKGAFAGNELPGDIEAMGIILISDTIRKEAPETFRFFEREGVEIKVISGDNPLTVSTVAGRAGLRGAQRYLDMTTVPDDADFKRFVDDYTVFGRVTPYQKQRLINALKQKGHTVAMTGDGVNDVLALKDADCSIAMAEGSDAARNVSDFVLLTSNFSAMINVVKEGRRVINNIERVASLYLVKTIYSSILSILFIFLPYPYPFQPIQLSPVSAVTVGIPSFFLALRPNYAQIKGRFLQKVLRNSLPAALTTVVAFLIISILGDAFGIPYEKTSTMSTLCMGIIGLLLLTRVSRPLDAGKITLIVLMTAMFFGIFIVLGEFFSLTNILGPEAFIYLPIILFANPMMRMFNMLMRKFNTMYHRAKISSDGLSP